MNWAGLGRRFQSWMYPRWMEGWQVRANRRRLATPLRHASSVKRRLFVDVSVISRNDAGTGIQRVVRGVASGLISRPPEGWEVIPVGATRKRRFHRISWPTLVHKTRFDYIEAEPGDVFLGLDFSLDDVHRHRNQLAAFKRAGGRLWFFMYDLLPVQRPDWFSDQLVVRYRRWLRAIAGLADGFHCISQVVETDLRCELAHQYGVRTGYDTRVLPMGWDVHSASRGSILPESFDRMLRQFDGRRTALVVGTLEPRKGHTDVLAAFNVLWSKGLDFNLVFVGRPGWKNDDLHRRVRSHEHLGHNLFWLEDASDAALRKLYEVCDGVIAASLAEGYGLPVLEALGHGKPVLARDLEVFHIHAARDIRYFPRNATAEELALSIKSWLTAPPSPAARQQTPLPTWADTTASVVQALEQGQQT